MAFGDGIRRDISKVSQQERDRFIAAIVKLDTVKFFPDGVTYWDKQEDIHKNAHFHGVNVHFGPGFIPWHRVIVNRLEGLLREVDPELSLHYWDWTTDPRSTSGGRAALFTPNFMGNANGDAGNLLNAFESTEDAETGNGHTKIWRDVAGTAANSDGTPALASDATILAGTDFQTFGDALKTAHDNTAHSYIGGTISDPHYSFHDPFVFLLHSNLDRLWAQWQTDPAHPERLNPATAYAGLSVADQTTLATENVEPWAGGTGLEPWASDPTKRAVITYTDPSVVVPACYDTNASAFQVLEAENPFNAATSRFQLNFNDVPEEETTWRAAIVRIRSCGDVNLRVKPGTEPAAPFGVSTPAVLSKSGPTDFRDVLLWFQFTAGAVGSAPQTNGPVNTTVRCDENGQEFQFELRANTIHRPTVAVELSLDQSGSMADPAGTSGATRLQVLKDAATLFSQLIQKNNGFGITRFDDDAYPPNDPTYGGMSITKVNNDGFGDGTRVTAAGVIAAHGAHGNTSIGDGLEMARNQLNGIPAGSYDDKAIILMTDGLENTPKMIADVTGLIDSQTFAIGLGNETQVNTAALTALAGSTGGALLLSGLLSASLDDQFRLRKFFMQILAGVTKTSIVKDPVGYLVPGVQLRIPFILNEADISCRGILLTDLPVISLAIETPDGTVFDSGAPGAVHFDTAATVRTARFNLPLAFKSKKAQVGTWNALLEIDRKVLKKVLGDREHPNRLAIAELQAKGARYCFSAHAFSNLRMAAKLTQSGFAPGSTLYLRASLTEYGVPVEHRATVTADLEYPDGAHGLIKFAETGPGIFEASLVGQQTGIYRFHLLAEGGTFRGAPFTREQLLDGAIVARGIGEPSGQPASDGIPPAWCKLLTCLLSEKNLSKAFDERLRREGISLDGIRRCIEMVCRKRRS
jgi:Common central domain of tyrosinase/von Willebrand factor type A domain